MSRFGLKESEVEDIALDWLADLGYTKLHGPDIASDGPSPERPDYEEVILPQRLQDALARLNPTIPPDALDEACRKVMRRDGPSLVANNRAFHRMLVDGVEVEYKRPDGTIAGDRARLLDPDNADNNDWVAVNQFTVIDDKYNRRPDIVLFVNGLPLVVIELKNPTDEDATIWSAFNQLQTYKQQISALFTYNGALVVSDGLEARIGSLTAGREWFKPWNTIEGEELAPTTMLDLEVLLRGAFEPNRFLRLLRHYIVFEDAGGGEVTKIIAGYHQFHAAERAVEATVEAAGADGDQRVGVVWHTQGSGKSLTMAFYSGRVVVEPSMQNPTLVVLTDRNDLDNQLFGTFSGCQDLLRQPPVQAASRAHLRELLQVASGGVIFTTIQKFFPEAKGDTYPMLSERGNIVVIADEAHRSQYDFIDGFARHMRDAMPNASFIGFTGTPIEVTDKNTRAVFGDYISVYDIQRAVDDGATVPIYYEGRLAKIQLDPNQQPQVDEDFEEATEGEEIQGKEKLKTKWAALEALVGADKRTDLIAEDLVKHFEDRLDVMDGKGMIVCMSRRICVELYAAITRLRPDWHDEEDEKGAIKVVMTGSASDPLEWQQHVRNKQRREQLALRFKKSEDPLQLVLVRDMWLTGFDAPSLHTMYVDKPMRSHGLMQAIARVNRVFRDKPGGLIVDYLGIATHLKHALATYTASGGKGKGTIDVNEAVAVMKEKYEICLGIMHGLDWTPWSSGTAVERLSLIPAAQEQVLAQEDGKQRYLQAVSDLSKAFALAVPHDETLRIRDDVGFFQAVRAALAKSSPSGAKTTEEIEFAIRQIVSSAIVPEGVVDIFGAAGLDKPDISIMSEEFLAEVRDLPQKNLAVELLKKLLDGEIKERARKNVVQARSFSEMLERSVRAYQNRAVEVAQIIEELIELAKEMRNADRRGEDLGLSEDEIAFYDALETNDSAVQVLGDENLKIIARELVAAVRRNVTIDWTVKEGVRANMRVIIKRILRKYGYPPDKVGKATRTVLEQAEVICRELAA
jgi:type I restriction enzyme R subunit